MLSLPDEKSERVENLGQYIILIYGPPKVGKTSLASYADDPLFLMFEPGSKGLELYERPVKSWKDFRQYVIILKKDEDRFNTVVIDTGDVAYDRCLEYVCRQRGIDHPDDEGFGKGWNAVRKEFVRQINGLAMTGRGLIVISHSVEREVKKRSGGSFDRIMPSMAGQALKVIEGMADVIIYYDYARDDRRELRVVGDDLTTAGHRIETRFRYENGKPIHVIPAGSSPQEAWNNLNEAFNNRLAEPELVKKKKRSKNRGR